MRFLVSVVLCLLLLSSASKADDVMDQVRYYIFIYAINRTPSVKSEADIIVDAIMQYHGKTDPLLIASIIDTESTWRKGVVNTSSGCMGLMQIHPGWPRTWAKNAGILIEPGENMLDIQTNIRVGCAIFEHYYYDDDYFQALKRYSGGDVNYARKVSAKYEKMVASFWKYFYRPWTKPASYMVVAYP